MKTNLGPYDRIIRIVIGGGAIIAGLVYWSWWGALGLIPLITAFIGYCPLYSPLHLNTCSAASGKPAPRPVAPPAPHAH